MGWSLLRRRLVTRRLWFATSACIVAGSLIGCSTARPIQSARRDQLNSNATEATAGPLVIRAAVLGALESGELLQVDTADRQLVAVIFSVANTGNAPLSIAQDDFRLQTDGGRRIAPSLPGRAASLLRNDSQSAAAIWTEYLALGILAAPAIDSAERQEAETTRKSRDLIFAGSGIAPGETLVGYLVFESPMPVDELSELALAFQAPNAPEAIHLPLVNPYRHR